MKINALSEEMKFLIIGGVGLLLAAVIFYYYNQYLKIDQNYSIVIAFVVNEIFSFMMKKFWIFQNRAIKEMRIQLFWTFVLAIAYLQTGNQIVYYLVNNWHMQKDNAKVLLVSAFLIPNFYISRRIFISQKTQLR